MLKKERQRRIQQVRKNKMLEKNHVNNIKNMEEKIQTIIQQNNELTNSINDKVHINKKTIKKQKKIENNLVNFIENVSKSVENVGVDLKNQKGEIKKSIGN
jgi:hypothetical protein